VDSRELFRSYALNAIDTKGRVAIPAGLRAVIEKNSATKMLMLSKHESDPCLSGYDREYSRILHSKLEKREDEDRAAGRVPSRHNINRMAFGLVEEIPFDGSGRFILPAFMRKKAGLEDLAFFLGAGDTFEVWNPHRLLEAEGVDEDVKEIVRFLLEEREAA